MGLFCLQGLSQSIAQSAATDPPVFVPGELIIGYKSQGDREQAIQELNLVKDQLKQRGDNNDEMQFEAVGDSALKLRIESPAKTRGSASDQALELKGLRDTAKNIKETDSRVRYAHPNWILKIDSIPARVPIDVRALDELASPQSTSDPGQPNDYAFVRGLHWDYAAPPMGMNAVNAWQLEKGSRDIVVAVLDTGLLFDHPDISTSGNVLPGYNFVTESGRGADAKDPGEVCREAGLSEPSWHGTHIAGIIGAVESNNGRGIAGINWKVSILPVRVVGRCGATFADIAAGLLWAAGLSVSRGSPAITSVPQNSRPADVINISLGAALTCDEEHAGLLIDAIKRVRDAGSVVVAAAGNNGQHVIGVAPAGCPGVISVAAGDRNGKLAWYSNFGNVTLMAPGGDLNVNDQSGFPAGVWSTIKVSVINGQGIEPQQGTSMAAPHVSGAIALALANHSEWRRKPHLIEQEIRSSVSSVADGACSRPCGYGQLDALKLVQAH